VNLFTLLDLDGSVLVIWTTDFPCSTTFEESAGAPRDPEAHAEDLDHADPATPTHSWNG
jgi:hypothetical protein